MSVAPLAASAKPFYITGGTMPVQATSYLKRNADEELFTALAQGDFCYVLNARQMGKSSLMVRTALRLKDEGTTVAILDLTAIGQNLTPEQWYYGLVNQLGEQTNTEDDLDDFWNEHPTLGPMQRFLNAIEKIVLPNVSRLVLFVDEIDSVRSLPFSADEFFAGIRQCFTARATNKDFERLTFCLLGTATPADLIRDARITPFNIGRRIELSDFTAEEAKPLASELPGGNATLSRILYWTGGHPYLTQRLCKAVSETGKTDVDTLCSEMFLSHQAVETDDNLTLVRDRLLRSEADLAALLTLYRQVVQSKRVPDDETNALCDVLKLSGVVRVEKGLLKVRNAIYARVFNPAWIDNHLPDAELRRQRAAFKRGVLRTAGIATFLLLVMGVLLVISLINAKYATLQANLAIYNSYVANMNALQSQWEDHNVTGVRELLDSTRFYPKRGFEWGYWNRLSDRSVKLLKGHRAALTSVAFSPDGTRIVTGSGDKTAIVWDAVRQNSLLTLQHSEPVQVVAFSPDGKCIATGCNDNKARVWNAATGKLLRTFVGHSDAIGCLTFSPDGKRIATGSDDSTAKVWDISTGKELVWLRGHTYWIWAIAFSPDGKRIVTGGDDGTARVWDATTGKELRSPLPGEDDAVYSVTFSPEGKRILIASRSIAKVVDATTGKELVRLTGHSAAVYSAAFSRDGKQIVTGSYDNTARVWDATTGKEVRTLKGTSLAIKSVAFSPDGQQVVTACDDGTAQIWNLENEGAVLTLKGTTEKRKEQYDDITSVSLSPDGERIVAGVGDGTACIWDANSGKLLQKLTSLQKRVEAVCFSPDGKKVALGGDSVGDNQYADAHLWGKRFRDLHQSQRKQACTVQVFDSLTGEFLSSFEGHSERIKSLAFSRDGKRLATGSMDKTVKVWDAASGKELLPLKGHRFEVNSVAFFPDSKRIVTGSWDGTARVWDGTTGREYLAFKGHRDAVLCAAVSPDGRRIVTASLDNTAKIWDVGSGRQLCTLRGHSSWVMAVAYSKDGKRIVTGSMDKTAKVWDAESGNWDKESGRELLTLKGHSGPVSSVAFFPDGKHIATGSWDGTVKVWEAKFGTGVR